jgi:hypothetical protein
MKVLDSYLIAFTLMLLSVGNVSAQDTDASEKYHPFLSDKFHIGLGVYRPSKRAKIGVDADLGGSEINDSLEGTDTQSTGSLNFRWRFTKNWSFQGTYWNVNTESQQTLTEDFVFQGEVFQAGSFVRTGLETSIARLFWGRSFFRRPSTDWGVGVGLHWMEIDAFVEGEILVSPPPPPPNPLNEFRHESTSASVPLPNLGIWYMYSWSPKWVVLTRLDWLDVTIDEFSGTMIDASVGVNYQMSRHFGIGLAVNGFKLEVDIDSTNWKGGIETRQVGPRLNITWNW